MSKNLVFDPPKNRLFRTYSPRAPARLFHFEHLLRLIVSKGQMEPGVPAAIVRAALPGEEEWVVQLLRFQSSRDKREYYDYRLERLRLLVREFSPGKDSSTLASYRRRFRGETALVLGNGPSLSTVNDALLRRFHTFGANGVIHKHVPNFYVLAANAATNVFGPIASSLPSELVLVADHLYPHFSKPEKLVRLNSVPAKYGTFRNRRLPVPARFSTRPDRVVYLGGTVLFVCLQIALFMGFSRVVLLGVDHDYGVSNHAEIYHGVKLTMGEKDPHHFLQYWPPGTELHSDLHAATRGFDLAKAAFRRSGATLLNATPNSALAVLPKVNADEILR